jgi:hypothetical protein
MLVTLRRAGPFFLLLCSNRAAGFMRGISSAARSPARPKQQNPFSYYQNHWKSNCNLKSRDKNFRRSEKHRNSVATSIPCGELGNKQKARNSRSDRSNKTDEN